MDLRIPWQGFAALVVLIGGATWGVWWAFVRSARPPRQSVSTTWLDERIRGRRP